MSQKVMLFAQRPIKHCKILPVHFKLNEELLERISSELQKRLLFDYTDFIA